MKLVIWAYPNLYSHRRIVGRAQARPRHRRDQHAARAYEHHLEQADAVARRAHAPRYDAVIPASAPRFTHYGWQCCGSSSAGRVPLNESVAIGRSRDKLRALQLLAAKASACR